MKDERRRGDDDRRIYPALWEFSIMEAHRLREVNKELVAAIENALVAIRICSTPAGQNVASNETLLQITADGLRATLAQATQP